jgi:hypothetical protein
MSADESNMYAAWLVDLANISAGALVFGHFASAQQVSSGLILLGIVTTLALYFVAHLLYKVAREREHT